MATQAATRHASPVKPLVYAVPSASQPGMVHQLSVYANGAISCTCRGFTMRGYCRHATEHAAPSQPAIAPYAPHAHCVGCGCRYAWTEYSPLYCRTCRVRPA